LSLIYCLIAVPEGLCGCGGKGGRITLYRMSYDGWINRRKSFDINFKPAKYGNYV
jgi:hypothetical protein